MIGSILLALSLTSNTSSLYLDKHVGIAPATVGVTLRLATDVRGWALFTVCGDYSENPATSSEDNGERVIRRRVDLPFPCDWEIRAQLQMPNGTAVLRDRVSVE